MTMRTNLFFLFLLGALVEAPAQHPVFPLKLDPSHRYLVDQNNRPFFVHGDSPWSLTAQLTASQAASYFSTCSGVAISCVNQLISIEIRTAFHPSRSAWAMNV